MTTLADLPEILTTEELAKALRVSKNTVYEEVRAGRLPIIRMSDRVWALQQVGSRALDRRPRVSVALITFGITNVT
jgi:excisionase family DNA binding protein